MATYHPTYHEQITRHMLAADRASDALILRADEEAYQRSKAQLAREIADSERESQRRSGEADRELQDALLDADRELEMTLMRAHLRSQARHADTERYLRNRRGITKADWLIAFVIIFLLVQAL